MIKYDSWISMVHSNKGCFLLHIHYACLQLSSTCVFILRPSLLKQAYLECSWSSWHRERDSTCTETFFLIFLLGYNFHNHKCTLSKCTIQSVRFSRSVVSDSLEPMNCSTSGFHVHHQLPELEQTHIHPVSDAIQASHLLLPPSPPAFSFSQHWGLF